MRRYALAKQIIGKAVITNQGDEIGRLYDITIDEKSGRIEGLVVEPNRANRLAKELARNGMIKVPYRAVYAVGELIIVDANLLT